MICTQREPSVIFVVDPMCSWCWGFAPVMETLLEEFDETYTFSLVVGGLRTKGQMTWDEASKAYLRKHWQQVHERTGQTFSTSLLDKETFEYDTYPACKAVVSVRECFGMKQAFLYVHLLQEAFYVKGLDIAQKKNLAKLVQDASMDMKVFETFFESERAQTLMEHDFAKARSMGANAFPSVVLIDGDGHLTCQKGYRSLEEMKQLLGEYHA